ncbi:DUF397 domain-containing protein [Amycolatopsis sp. NPDC059021]|uniref:DUF397 domain-containing protein n=1 Tax=Amycolatopsis sp. NPDC059021 TaxID=3346704 RepID=UPI00366BA0BF
MITPDLTGAQWRKSTRSGGVQGCVEIATGTDWHKSSHSGGGQGCVEVTHSSRWAAIRDTKNRDAGALTFSAEAFTAFLAAAKNA